MHPLDRIDAQRADLAGQTIVAARKVQAGLFDLWGDLEHLAQQHQLEPWLTLSIARHNFTTAELDPFLAALAADLAADPLVNIVHQVRAIDAGAAA